MIDAYRVLTNEYTPVPLGGPTLATLGTSESELQLVTLGRDLNSRHGYNANCTITCCGFQNIREFQNAIY